MAEEVERMGVTVDWSQYPAVQEIARDSEARGVRKALLFLLQKRFGTLPAWAAQKVEEASEEKAMAWLAKAGDAATLAELIPRR